MKNFLNYLMLILIASISLTFTSCKDDDGPESSSQGTLSRLSMEQIKSTFPGLRLDSIHSQSGYKNIKITYNNNLLSSYKECYSNGNVHDGVSFNVTYSRDTVYANSYKAVIGENGLVAKLICPNGKVNEYEYDEHNHLIKYASSHKIRR